VTLPFASTTEHGVHFETGVPVTFKYVRNTQGAPRPGIVDTYQQRIEPRGRYMLHNPNPGALPRGWTAGTVRFENPLVIWFNAVRGAYYDDQSWKMRLHKHYRRQGAALARALHRDGYDGIVTVMPGTDDTREILEL